jgi:hypothetical protein
MPQQAFRDSTDLKMLDMPWVFTKASKDSAAGKYVSNSKAGYIDRVRSIKS